MFKRVDFGLPFLLYCFQSTGGLKMGKRKDWVYQEANGCTVGLMKCCSCGKKITEGEFRYYDAGEAYVCQCKACGGTDSRWIEKDRQQAARERKQWEEDARTDHIALLARIEHAYKEGVGDAGRAAYDVYETVDELWEQSEAKRIHDVLKELWSVQ
jgi:hypothetical protein